ncbi:MAG TPA: MFS transporter [Solirubrobacteraceae bacterium]|nr:MFS transporter [Solirubrobacteraceae bacterium]
MKLLAPQRAVLTARGVRPLLTIGLFARLPIGMTALGLILLLRGAGRSYALAGLADGAFALGVGVAQPLLGRMVDRVGLRRVMLPLALAFPAGIVTIALAGKSAPAGALAALAFATGALLPPVGAAMRAIWPQLVAPDLRATAYSIEAIVQELTFIVGPPVVAALAASSSPRDALLATAALGGGGAACFALIAHRASERQPPARGHALQSAGARVVLTLSLLLGASFGSAEVAMPAFAEHHGARAAAGGLLAAVALGSLLGGVLFGTRTTEANVIARLERGLVLCALTLAPLLLARSLAAMGVLMLVSGLPIAPTFAATYVLLDRVAVAGTATETFAWNTTAIFAGAALGNALGGVAIAASSYRASLALAIAFGLLSGLLALARSRELSLG